MNKKEVMAKLEKMPVEEKLKLLSETDKAFIHGYIERALVEQHRVKARQTKVRGVQVKDGQSEGSE